MEGEPGEQCAGCAVRVLPVSSMETTWDGVSLEFCWIVDRFWDCSAQGQA